VKPSVSRIAPCVLALAGSAALLAAPAFAERRGLAGTESGSHRASCSIGNVNGVDFPPYDVFSDRNDDGNGSFTIACSGESHNTTVQVLLSSGSGDSYTPRSMAGPGSAKIEYNLYAGPEYRTIWGDGSDGSRAIQQVVGRTPVTMTIYGRVFGKQHSAPAGNYADAITITIAP